MMAIELHRLPSEIEAMTVSEFAEMLAGFKIRSDEQDERIREARRGRG